MSGLEGGSTPNSDRQRRCIHFAHSVLLRRRTNAAFCRGVAIFLTAVPLVANHWQCVCTFWFKMSTAATSFFFFFVTDGSGSSACSLLELINSEIMNLTNSRQGSLDGWAVHRKAAAYTQDNTNTKSCRQISMPPVSFEPKILVLQRAKIIRILDRAATATILSSIISDLSPCLRDSLTNYSRGQENMWIHTSTTPYAFMA
jgi:hypothetical protein